MTYFQKQLAPKIGIRSENICYLTVGGREFGPFNVENTWEGMILLGGQHGQSAIVTRPFSPLGEMFKASEVSLITASSDILAALEAEAAKETYEEEGA